MHELHLLDSQGGNKDNDLYELHQIQAKKEALESSVGILELGLSEFPGCALLHLYYMESVGEYFYQIENEALHHSAESDGVNVNGIQSVRNKASQAFQSAWERLGRGSHVNEGMFVSEIYRLHGSFLLALLSCESRDLPSKIEHGMGIDADNICNIIKDMFTLCSRWSKTPMGEGANDEMMEDFNMLWNEALVLVTECKDERLVQLLQGQKTAFLTGVDDNRRGASLLTNVFSTYENDIDVAMTDEGIFFPYQILQQFNTDPQAITETAGKYLQMMKRNDLKWSTVLGNGKCYLLGLGGNETSRAFTKYGSFLQRHYQNVLQESRTDNNITLQDHMTEHGHSLISSVYERAVSECPTVESLWMSYIRFLRSEWMRIRRKHDPSSNEEIQTLSNALRTISHRAVRNCPYSKSLFEVRMTTLGLISDSNLEPDDITNVIQEATRLGFLNDNREAMLSMRLVAVNVVKRKLLSLISLGTTVLLSNGATNERDYDQDDELDFAASNRKKSKTNQIQYKAMNTAAIEEIQDLIEDIRDMYEEADNYLFKSHSKWDEGKVCFWKHRCLTEAYVIVPVTFSLRNRDDEVAHELPDVEAMKCFEKLVKAQKPCHPDSWREYLRYISTLRLHYLSDETAQASPGEIGALPAGLRQTRGLYKRAMSSMRKAGKATADNGGFAMDNMLAQRDYDLALSDLCHEYLNFEQNFGSEESVSAALALVRSKMANYDGSSLQPTIAIPTPDENSKRKFELNELNGDQMQDVDTAETTDDNGRSKRIKVKTNLKEPKKTDSVHKVRIGKMDYPAHPFTIHVSNLNKDTQDMDLVDSFRQIGAVVHAKILREKLYGKGGHHAHGESKGCGLVQFEERMSVETALQQNGELKIGDKVVKISRSHLPAVGVVPQGMHRVNPKGEGKMSKRNQLKKKTKTDDAMDVDTGVEEKDAKMEEGQRVNATKNKYRTSSSPGSIKLDSLSFKPRAVKPKTKMSLTHLTKK